MEFLRAYVKEETANTYTKEALQCPTSKTENMAMLIHMIEIIPGLPDLVANQMTKTTAGFRSDGTKTNVDGIEVPDIIWVRQRVRETKEFTIDANTYGSVLYVEEPPEAIRQFDPPLLYSKQQIYCFVMGMNNTATKGMAGRIGYTVERISREDFIAALVE